MQSQTTNNQPPTVTIEMENYAQLLPAGTPVTFHVKAHDPDGAVQWLRVLTRVALHRGAGSPFVHTLQGRTVDVRFERPTVYELDGGTRAATDQLCFEVKPRAVSICVPDGAMERSGQ